MKRLCLCSWLSLCLVACLLTTLTPSDVKAETCPVLAPVCTIKDLPLLRNVPNSDLADVYYPNVPASSRKYFKDAFPVVVVLQGANVDKSFYSQFGTRLAASLFVVIIPNHFRSVPTGLPFPPVFTGLFSGSSVVSNALAWVKNEDNNNLSSPLYTLYTIADTKTVGLVGHSFGGVAGLYASAVDGCSQPQGALFCEGSYTRPAGLKAAVFYGTNLVVNVVPPPCPPNSPKYVVTDLNTSGVAVTLMQGMLDGSSCDPNLPSLQKAELTYPTLEDPRGLITIDGANHYGICDMNNPPASPAFPFLPAPTSEDANHQPILSQNESVTRVALWTGLWLRAQLKNDPVARWWIYQAQGSPDEVVDVCTEDLAICKQQ